MSDSIRINSTGKKIQVNDSGDFITLELKNTTFMNGLIGLMRELETNAQTLLSQIPTAENDSVEEVSVSMARAAEVCGQLSARTDEVFGAGTCRKVFGEQAPGIYEFADFFDQIGALVRKYGEEETARAAEIVEKYKGKYAGKR